MKINKELEKIRNDCLRLKKQNQLTEFGKGELHIIKLIKRTKKPSHNQSANPLRNLS